MAGGEQKLVIKLGSSLMLLYKRMQAVKGDYKSRARFGANITWAYKAQFNRGNKMRRAVFLLSVAIATAMATSYEQTGDCEVSG